MLVVLVVLVCESFACGSFSLLQFLRGGGFSVVFLSLRRTPSCTPTESMGRIPEDMRKGFCKRIDEKRNFYFKYFS